MGFEAEGFVRDYSIKYGSIESCVLPMELPQAKASCNYTLKLSRTPYANETFKRGGASRYSSARACLAWRQILAEVLETMNCFGCRGEVERVSLGSDKLLPSTHASFFANANSMSDGLALLGVWKRNARKASGIFV